MSHRHIPALEVREALGILEALEALEFHQGWAMVAPRQDRVQVWATPALTAWMVGSAHPPRRLQLRSLAAMAGPVTTVSGAGSVSQSLNMLLRRHRRLQTCLHMHTHHQQSPMLPFQPHTRPQMDTNMLAVTGTVETERSEMPSS